jgi:hypothetical protein
LPRRRIVGVDKEPFADLSELASSEKPLGMEAVPFVVDSIVPAVQELENETLITHRARSGLLRASPSALPPHGREHLAESRASEKPFGPVLF